MRCSMLSALVSNDKCADSDFGFVTWRAALRRLPVVFVLLLLVLMIEGCALFSSWFTVMKFLIFFLYKNNELLNWIVASPNMVLC